MAPSHLDSCKAFDQIASKTGLGTLEPDAISETLTEIESLLATQVVAANERLPAPEEHAPTEGLLVRQISVVL